MSSNSRPTGQHPFEHGNHSLAAREGSLDDWRTWAAWGLIGRADKALDGLARFDCPEARFHEAVALWIDGDDAAAAGRLAGLPGAHARALRALIEKPCIEVLAMLPANRHGPHVHLHGAAADSKFRIRNISTHPDDLPVRPYASIHDYLDAAAPPDLFIAEMVEWLQIPPDFSELACPTIGVTSDYDLHIQGLHPWLSAFDELVVNDHTEFAGLRPIIDRPVSVFPLLFGCPPDLPRLERRPRDIDVFMSGTLFAPYHPDKAALLHRLLDVPGLNVLYVNGHLSERAYFDLLARAKVTISYYRRPGGMVTRGIEAACMGCVTLVQETSVLGLYADPPHGLIEYDSSPEGLERTVRAVLADYERHEAAAWTAQDSLRQRLSAEQVASRFLRFCSYLATSPHRGARRLRPLIQKRNMFWKGWMPGNGDPAFIAALREGNVERLRALPGRDDNPDIGNDIAREALLDYCARLIHAPQADEARPLLVEALDELRRTIHRHPDALVPRFNFVRAAVHFGNEGERKEGLELARACLDQEPSRWAVDAAGDVFPYDYASAFFDYRSYIDRLMAAIRPDGVILPQEDAMALRDLILASLHHYCARCLDSAAHARAAFRLSPAFAPFRLDHARRLLQQDHPADQEEAVALLDGLVMSSPLAVQAHQALRHAVAAGVPVAGMERLDAHIARLEAQCVESEVYVHKVVGGYFQAQILGPGAQRGIRIAKAPGNGHPVELSVIVVDGGGTGRNTAELLGSLALQTLARAMYEVILVDLSDTSGLATEADAIILCGQDAPLFHRHRGFNAGLLQARGRLVCLVDGGEALQDTALAQATAPFLADGRKTPDGSLPSLVVTTPGTGAAVATLTCRRLDALLAGGVDQHEAYHGANHDLREFAGRLLNGEAELVPLGERPAAGSKAGTPPWAHVWPHVADGALRRRPHREMPGLVQHGLTLLAASPEGLLKLDGGLELMTLLRRAPNSTRTSDGLAVSKNEPPGRILWGPPLPVPAGHYRASFRILFTGAPPPSPASTPLRVVVSVERRPVFDRVFRVDELDGPAVASFTVNDSPKNSAPCPELDLELHHLGNIDWTVNAVELRRLAG